MWFVKWIKSVWDWFFPKPKPLPYEFKYPLNSVLDETDEHKLFKRVEEETPDGVVIMTYDEPTNTFLYWSDNRIAYKYLEVVARKYVIVYDCKENYINIFRELIKSMEKKKEVKEDGPFVTFKSYNTASHKINDGKIVNERSNQYKRLGKWEDREIPVITYKPLNYLEYKKQV